jgi:hypothetical protein
VERQIPCRCRSCTAYRTLFSASCCSHRSLKLDESITIDSSKMMARDEYHPQQRPPTREEMDAVFALCRNNHWTSCLQCLKTNPLIGTTTMIMDNHITTTVCHQAITSKGDIKQRAKVILQILEKTPQAASIKNGYGSLPLHVISQRNTKIDSNTKEILISALIKAFPGALAEEGGVGKRTPLHIIFTGIYFDPNVSWLAIMVNMSNFEQW